MKYSLPPQNTPFTLQQEKHPQARLAKRRQLTKRLPLGRLSCAALVSGLLTGCGGTGQDNGSPSQSSQVYSGLVIDGYLARSTVFIDSNNNGTRDAWEAWAFTDNQGYYSFNPNTNVDYCAASATPQQAQYCLVSNVAHSNVVIRIDGGYDIVTGEPFLGQMSRRVNATDQNDISDNVVSPLTSLLTNVESQNDRQSLLTALSISDNDLDEDYLGSNNENGVNAPLLNTSLKIHKVVTVLSDRLTDTYTEIGEDFGTPNDATSVVYPQLARQIINAQNNNGEGLDAALSNENTLVSALDAAETSLREVYERKKFTLPADMGSVNNHNAFERVAQVASEVSSVVNSLIDVDTSISLEHVTGSTRALETLVIKTVNETVPNDTNTDTSIDTSIDNVINFFSDPTNDSALVNSLLSALSKERADISALVNNDFNSDESIQAVTQLPDIQPFTRIGGLQIKISDLDLGRPPNRLDDSEVEFYFDGDPDDVDGSFKACVKHINGASVDGTLGDGNTRGELVEGFWSLLGATSDNPKSFSLLITITFLGTTYQAIMKPSGEETRTDPTDNQQKTFSIVRFDYDGELNTWHSEKDFAEIGTIPTTNQECQDKLPSRIGI